MLRLKTLLQYNYIYYAILVIAIFFSLFKIYIIKYESKYNIEDTKIIGTITNIKSKNDRYTLTIKGKEEIIAYYNKEIDLSLGDKVLLKGNLNYPLNNTIPNTFNYKKYLNNHNIYYLMDIKELKILNKNNNIFYKIKDKLYKRISSYDKVSNELKAFVIGDSSSLDEDDYYNYQRNGIVHLFAIGSTQITIISVTLFFFLDKTNIKSIIKYLIVFITLIIIVFILNYSASVIRSLLFFILHKLNKKYDFNISTKNILFLTISLLIFYNPKIIYDIGFQYSSLASYGLIISNIKNKKSYFKKLFYINIIATLFCLPITLINNYEINLLSPINNLIFVPLITFIIFPASILTIIFKFLEPIYYLLIIFINNLNSFIGNISFLNIIIPKVNNIWYLFYYILLIIYIYSRNNKYLIISLLLIFSFKIKPYFDNNTYIYFLDVGQGDSALIHNKKETIMIDTGGLYNYNVSNNTILFMKSLGIKNIDLLLLTHGDSDHMKDAPNIINKMNVKNVMLNKNEYNEIEKEILNLNINLIDNYESIFDFKIYNNYIGKDENDSSIICKLNINNNQILFMGDATKDEEKKFINDYKIKSTIIKLGHHGSKTSSDEYFLKEINAKEAIISSGRNNRFNHPSKETIDTLNNLKINYFNTAELGTIKYTFNNKGYIKTYYVP